MTTPADIAWGAYGSYEGVFFRGTTPLKLPDNPSSTMKRVYVCASTEGLIDSINGYDRCTMSIGVSQVCETPWFLTSMLLGHIADKDQSLLKPLQPALSASRAIFTKASRGKWRFHFLDERGEVDAGTEQKQLFLLNSDGTKGSWDDESKAHAKLWAASLANLLVQPAAQEAQIDWVAKRVEAYAMPQARKLLFSDVLESEGWVGALQAAYLSFALNIPTKANAMLQVAVKDAPGAKWSPKWCTHILKVMTFQSGVGIWPHRYEAVRKPLERLYGVDLPDTSEDLAAWKVAQGLADADDEDIFDEEPEAKGKAPTFTTVKEIQRFLIAQGYDLGPWGADGRHGQKTTDAVRTFQRLNGLGADGIVGPRTRAKMRSVFSGGDVQRQG